jgi:protein-disulfide isomerase
MDPELQIRPDDHVQGSARARLTLLEYGDYECPYCARAFVAIHEAQRALGPDLGFVFRNLPLTEIHPSALPAPQVAEAADLQGRFWPMHDALFTYQNDLSAETFVLLADEVGLDLNGRPYRGPYADGALTHLLEQLLRAGDPISP